MIIRSADFVTSAVKPSQYPPADLPEVAFAGRSNVGKSSMINCLVNRRKLVKTSQRPGKTQLVNFFVINEGLRFVDLPGYGYAKVSKAVKRQWGPMIESYLDTRSTLCGLFLLMDLRREPGEEEWRLLEWLAQRGLPARVVLTKADKLSRSRANDRRLFLAKETGLDPEALVLFSAKTRQGREPVWRSVCAMTGVPFAVPGEGKSAARTDQ